MNALSTRSFGDARADTSWWGRLVENAVGAHLLNHLTEPQWSLSYWRAGDVEVDYVVERGQTLWAIEVKSGRGGRLSGFAKFAKLHPSVHTLVIGSGGVPLEEYFGADPRQLLEA